MAGTGTGAKKYVVKLCAGERERLEAIIKSGKRDIADHLVPEINCAERRDVQRYLRRSCGCNFTMTPPRGKPPAMMGTQARRHFGLASHLPIGHLITPRKLLA